MSGTNFETRLSDHARQVEFALDELLDRAPLPGEITRPKRLLEAMRYACLDGGKRLRPFLLIECAALFGIGSQEAMGAATAIECVHCYSLIHDDLPAMDDDDLRRGKPTVHKAYDEGLAILAGDGLLTLAFEILARPETHESEAVRIKLIQTLSMASGLAGMVGGQNLDLDGEEADWDAGQIRLMQSMKTGALLKAACTMGGLIGNAGTAELAALENFGKLLGQVFQLTDDILDVTSSPLAMGKATAKDSQRGKSTLVSHLGLNNARALAQQLVEEAKAELAVFDLRSRILCDAADFVVSREI